MDWVAAKQQESSGLIIIDIHSEPRRPEAALAKHLFRKTEPVSNHLLSLWISSQESSSKKENREKTCLRDSYIKPSKQIKDKNIMVYRYVYLIINWKKRQKQYSKAMNTKQNISIADLVFPCCFLCFFFFNEKCAYRNPLESTAQFWRLVWPFHY